MRAGEQLVAMTPDRLKAIFDESEPDFSAKICPGASLDHLSPEAIARFRTMWLEKSGNQALAELSDAQLLADAKLLIDRGVTYAALVLLGTPKALGRHLAQAELIFEYRSSEANIAHQQREAYREAFLLFHDALWQKINLRNDLFSYQNGLVRRKVPTFNEEAVREAILNAVSHRDYRLAGSVFVRQWPRKIEIVSPGGFPSGVTAENLLIKHVPRNRLIAETLERCDLVERAGQGADTILKACLGEGKLPPDFTRSDKHEVAIVLDGNVRDPEFVRFLKRIEAVKNAPRMGTNDLVVLDAVHRERPIPETEETPTTIDRLCDLGILERQGDGFILSTRHYHPTGLADIDAIFVDEPRSTEEAIETTNKKEARIGNGEAAHSPDLKRNLPPGRGEADRFQIENEVGNWIIDRELGAGGMGTVYRAHHKVLKTPAAVKLLAPALTLDKRIRDRFLVEAQTQAQLRHPHIAQVLDYVEQDGKLFLVIEYLENGSLADVVERTGGPVPIPQALQWISQALEALDAAHQNAVIHGDVKSSNILLDRFNNAKITDFGIVMVLGERRLASTGMSLGTPHYMSPEQIVNPHQVDHRTDVYSIGIVLYELLAGKVPFESDSDFMVREAQVNRPPPGLRELNPEVPQALEEALMRALAKDRDQRYSGCGEFAREISVRPRT